MVPFFSRIQPMTLGAIGEYVGYILDEVRRSAIFTVDVLKGFEQLFAKLQQGLGAGDGVLNPRSARSR